MKRFLVMALCLAAASAAFASGPLVGLLHAKNGYDYKDMSLTLTASSSGSGVLWLGAGYNYQLLPSERDILVQLVQIAQKKIDIAVANKSTISYTQDIGGFFTDNAALVTVAFLTDGFLASYTVVHIKYMGDDTILLLDKTDTQDFLSGLGNARMYIADYDRQVALFR